MPVRRPAFTGRDSSLNLDRPLERSPAGERKAPSRRRSAQAAQGHSTKVAPPGTGYERRDRGHEVAGSSPDSAILATLVPEPKLAPRNGPATVDRSVSLPDSKVPVRTGRTLATGFVEER